MPKEKNLTRYTYETAAFEGWRLCIRRSGTTFTKYYSDRKYGNPDAAFAAALKTRDELIELLNKSRRIQGKLTKKTIKEAQQLLKNS